MRKARFSWLVVGDLEVGQVDADECRTEPTGGLSFWNTSSDGTQYLTCSYPAGAWSMIQIMSQMTGTPNGRAVVSRRKTKSSAWESQL